MVKNLPEMQETQETWFGPWIRENPMDKGMAAYSGILAWEIPWTEGPGGLWSMGSQRVGHEWSNLAGAAAATLIILGLSSHDQKTFYIYLGLFHFFQCFVVFSVVFV